MVKKIFLGLGTLLLLFIVFLYTIYKNLPDPKLLETWTPPQASEVYDTKGRYYGTIGTQKRFYVPLEKIPNHVINAFIAVEDRNFWHHFGVDPLAILRAALANYRAGKIVQGGSTITQQLARNLFLTPKRTFERKLKEALLAIKIERNFNKEKILELYLNQIYLGSGSYGVEAASQVYFGKHVWELSLEEAALLAGLPKAPAKYNPFYHPDRALERRNFVLKRMYEEGFITQEEYEEAINKPLLVKKENKYKYSDYLLDMVKEYVFKKYGELAYKGRLEIYTTVDIDYQRQAEKSLKEGLSKVAKIIGIPFLPETEEDMKIAYEKEKELKKLKRGKVYVAKILKY
ncbi:MAG TPA: peptidase, partial [Aquificaceae bacterium]|nr:peptidase [Aquificaceae bacterium]